MYSYLCIDQCTINLEDEIVSTSHLELPEVTRWRRGDEDQNVSRRSSKGSRTDSVSIADSESMRKGSFSESDRGRVSTVQEDKESIARQVKELMEKKKIIEMEKSAVGNVRF